MDFFSQAWIGIRKELSAYKQNPRLLLTKAISIIIFAALTIIIANPNNSTLASSAVTTAIFQMQIFYTPARMIINKISSERAENFKEYLMVNGMSKGAYQAKIAVGNYLEMFFFAIPQTVSLYVNFHSYISSYFVFFQMFLVTFVSGLGTVNLALFVSTALSPQNAPSIGSMIVLLMGLLYFAAVGGGSLMIYLLCSISPSAASSLAIISLLPNNPAAPDDRSTTNMVWDGFNAWLAILVIILSGSVFLFLYLYRERDQDTDLKQISKKKGENNSEIQTHLLQGNNRSDVDLESSGSADVSSATHHEHGSFLGRPKTIEAIGIKKVFDDFTAVNGVTFSIYEEEIFCLLGHNGAGKTTLISILTGLIPKTEGRFFYNGEEILSSLEKIRGSIGFCPQKDYLLFENTVAENLSFFAEIKGIPADQVEEEIQRVINRLGLGPYKDMLAKKLSGGWKRKLNVAIALLNNPKIIIMDEPTSGMDPVSRRNFWKIIKDLKDEKKTVVLTTQFLDEAEELADRVAIVSKGKLFALGSSDYIKKKFGTGYNLIIKQKDNSAEIQSRSSEIFTKIQSVIPSVSRRHDVPSEILQFTLPFNEQDRFSSMFAALENVTDIIMNLQMVSLEEAFVTLGINPEQATQEEKNFEFTEQTQSIPESFLRERTPTFQDQLGATLLRMLYRAQRNKRFIFFASFPLVFIAAGIVIASRSNHQDGVATISTMMLIGNSFLIVNFLMPPFNERITKITHTLKAMGLRTLPYWLAMLIADSILQTIMCGVLVATIYLSNNDFMRDNIASFIALYLASAFNMIVLAYNSTFTFDNPSLVLAAGPGTYLLGYFLPSLVDKVLEKFSVNILTYLYYFSFIFLGPILPLQQGINTFVAETDQDQTFLQNAPFKSAWPYALFTGGMGVLLFLRLLYKDSQLFELREKKKFTEEAETSAHDTQIEDDDVNREKERLAHPQNADLIKVNEVEKIYPNGFKAVHDLSFGVEEGQVFCLLGPNGAGKTTSFEMITAMIPKSGGDIKLKGKELARKNHEIFYDIGICPQVNPLWESLTVTQHLRIYAKIKGLRGNEIDEAIAFLLRTLQLEEYAHRDADKLSGGNKRKLCVANCMIGAPSLIFLDEPSTGMDPVARSFLWTLIKDVMKAKKASMVLTTHYMQEAELVGDKLGILVNGRFATIGSMVDMKNKYGEYTVMIDLLEGGLEKKGLIDLVKSVLPKAKQQKDTKDSRLALSVPSSAMKFVDIFALLEDVKQQGKIQDFSIYTTTLEQIFIKLAKHQRRLTES